MPSRREPIWTGNFIAVSFVNLFVFLSFQMIFPTLPLYVKSLGGSDAVIGLVMGIFTAATLIARPTAGILLDRIGKKKVLLCGLGVFTVMVYLYGMVGSIALIILVRLGHGLGWGSPVLRRPPLPPKSYLSRVLPREWAGLVWPTGCQWPLRRLWAFISAAFAACAVCFLLPQPLPW